MTTEQRSKSQLNKFHLAKVEIIKRERFGGRSPCWIWGRLCQNEQQHDIRISPCHAVPPGPELISCHHTSSTISPATTKTCRIVKKCGALALCGSQNRGIQRDSGALVGKKMFKLTLRSSFEPNVEQKGRMLPPQ